MVHGTTESTDTDHSPKRIAYHRAECSTHPAPRRPGTEPWCECHRSRQIIFTPDPEDFLELQREIVPDECPSCEEDVETIQKVLEWPPLPLTDDAAVAFLNRADGQIALKFPPLNSTDDPIDWQGIVGVEDIEREEEWYVGIVDGTLLTRTEESHRAVWPHTEFSPADFGPLLKHLQPRPTTIDGTPIEPIREDWKDGVAVTASLS